MSCTERKVCGGGQGMWAVHVRHRHHHYRTHPYLPTAGNDRGSLPYIRSYDRRFPIGRTRMAELSVLACAAIMFVSTSLVIRESIGALWDGFHGKGRQQGAAWTFGP